MSDGFGCKCMARSASECCCEHVDWRSSREVELEIENDDLRKARKIYLDSIEQLRAENAALKAELKSIDGALDDPRANLTLTTAEVILEIKAELAEAKKDAERYREWKYRFREGECELFSALADCATDEEHDAAIDAAMKGK